ncbi:MAG: dipeptide/oligopeptide/nickel ABC transporter ATP-binding protein, partial [Spirochaetes bacterium GWC1_27_15]
MSLVLKDVKKHFNLEAGLFARYGKFVYAVNGVSFDIKNNEAFGLVGESGCGKTTVARLIVQMYKHSFGHISFTDKNGTVFDLDNIDNKNLKLLRNKIRYIFQDPARSLNPRMTILDVLTSGYKYSPFWKGNKKAKEESTEILESVGLSEKDLERRPQDFSGGQRQRISIARALLTKPELLICDEVVSALDVSIQSQILNLLVEIRKKYQISLLFIAHDLTVVSYFCDRIGVMYGGQIVELGSSKSITEKKLHPYTQLLYSSIPDIKNRKEILAEKTIIE